MLLGKGVLKICSKFTGEHPCQSVISVKLICSGRLFLSALQPFNFTKSRLFHIGFFGNFPTFSGDLFLRTLPYRKMILRNNYRGFFVTILDVVVSVLAIGKTYIRTGQKFFLFCQLSANSDATYTWYRNDKVLSATKSLLVINATKDDAGKYTCEIHLKEEKKKSKNNVIIFVERK